MLSAWSILAQEEVLYVSDVFKKVVTLDFETYYDKKFSLLGMSLMENHYDPRYKKSRLRNSKKIISSIELGDISNEKIEKSAEKIKYLISDL